MKTSVKSALYNLAAIKRILFKYSVNIFLSGLDSQILEIASGILLLEYFEKSRVFDIKFLDVKGSTSALGPILIWKTWLSAIFLLSLTLIISYIPKVSLIIQSLIKSSNKMVKDKKSNYSNQNTNKNKNLKK